MLKANDIAIALKEDRSKAQVNRIVEAMHIKGFDFGEFIETLRAAPLPVKWYMSWTLNHYIESDPHLLTEQQILLWDLLNEVNHEGMQRDLWRALTFIEIDDEIGGAIYENGIKTFISEKNALAVRVNALQCSYNIALKYPELSQELLSILDSLPNNGSAALTARVKMLKKPLQKRCNSF